VTAYATEETLFLSDRMRMLLTKVHFVLLLLALALIPAAVVILLSGSPWLLFGGLFVCTLSIVLFRWRRVIPSQTLLLCALAALCYHEIAAMGLRRLDTFKSFRSVVAQILRLVPDRDRFFGYKLDETMTAVLPYYGDVSPRSLSTVGDLNAVLASKVPSQVLVLERHLEASWPKLEFAYDVLLRIEMSERRVILLIGNLTKKDERRAL
jgi:hypothetical protein